MGSHIRVLGFMRIHKTRELILGKDQDPGTKASSCAETHTNLQYHFSDVAM